jgi:hypothetical protein|tara:strand:+ start:3778 stop:3972 length:195 start_codon:yes stop_codon:yes gene_type:complete
MIKIGDKEYDENKLSEDAKRSIAQLQEISKRKIKLTMNFQDQDVLQNHYNKILLKELSKNKKSN